MTKSLPSKSLVLYADDDKDDQALISELFQDLSGVIDLRTFANGEELLHFVERLHPLEPQPSLILLDINMPVLDGISTLKRLRERPEQAGLPVVLFTTSTMPYEKRIASQYNAGFIIKPIFKAQVQRLVDELLLHCPEEFRVKVNSVRGK